MDDRTTLRRRQVGHFGWAPVGLIALVFALAACTSDPVDEVSVEDYRTQLTTVCTNATASRLSLTEPTDSGEVAAFALNVAAMVDAEAEQARALSAPNELDADHRAFVQNTADQAARWRLLATTSPDDIEAFGSLQTEILELTLGRDDLTSEMGIDACRRSSP